MTLPPAPPECVERAQRRLGATFPRSYVERLFRKNGGSVEAARRTWQLYPLFDDTDLDSARSTSADVVHHTELARTWAEFPCDAVVVGGSAAGDRLVLTLDAPGRLGAWVYLWEHETGELTQVANDFAELNESSAH